MKLNVKVVPKSSRNCIVGWLGDTLKICVSVAPEHGKANLAVLRLVAEALEISKERVWLVAGASSPRKVVEIEGLDEPDLLLRLAKRVGR